MIDEGKLSTLTCLLKQKKEAFKAHTHKFHCPGRKLMLCGILLLGTLHYKLFAPLVKGYYVHC